MCPCSRHSGSNALDTFGNRDVLLEHRNDALPDAIGVVGDGRGGVGHASTLGQAPGVDGGDGGNCDGGVGATGAGDPPEPVGACAPAAVA